MTRQVNIPQRRSSGGLTKALGLAQTIGGAVSGNPMMALGGVNTLRQSANTGKGQPESVGTGGAVQRRLDQSDNDVPSMLKSLKDAEDSLPELDPGIRREYAPALFEGMIALKMDLKKQGLA